MRDFKDVPDEAIRATAAPTLVVGADRDMMQPEGAVALHRGESSPVWRRLVTLTTSFMTPDGTLFSLSAEKVRWKSSDNVIQTITSQCKESQRRQEHALGCSWPVLIGYL
jgi:hypothetical protein